MSEKVRNYPCYVTECGGGMERFTEIACTLKQRDYKGFETIRSNAVIVAKRIDKAKKHNVCIDLTCSESRVIEIAPCIAARYDAGLCSHQLERGGVMIMKEIIDDF